MTDEVSRWYIVGAVILGVAEIAATGAFGLQGALVGAAVMLSFVLIVVAARRYLR